MCSHTPLEQTATIRTRPAKPQSAKALRGYGHRATLILWQSVPIRHGQGTDVYLHFRDAR